jgi:hypothetical protein
VASALRYRRKHVSDGSLSLNRRRTDGSAGDGEHLARRRIAEEAYRLFVERGRDPREADECWRRAELLVRGRSSSDLK